MDYITYEGLRLLMFIKSLHNILDYITYEGLRPPL